MNTLLTGIQTLLTTEFGATIKKYYIGKPNINRIVVANCPMIAIYPISTEQNLQGTGTLRDQNDVQIAIELIDSASTYYADTNSETQNASLVQFLTYMEKRDSSGNYATPSIMYALRTHSNFDLGGYSLFTDGFKIDYNDIAEDEDRKVVMARLVFRAVYRPNRNIN